MIRLIDKIENTIKEHKLIENGDRILIGLSGGADSAALTYALYLLKDKYNLTLYTAHLNHNIRGKDAKRDEKFAEEFSKKLGIECIVKSIPVADMAKERKKSEELVGREERYAFFYEEAERLNLDKIATAHNKNDNAETILMHFFRGSALGGLSGIPYKRGRIIRPVLDLERKEIEDFCLEYSLDYVTDKTNFEKNYTRNKVRLDILPMICSEFNKGFVGTVSENAKIIGEEDDFLKSEAEKILKECGDFINTKELKKLHPAMQRRVIMGFIAREYKSDRDIFSVYVKDIYDMINKGISGKRISLPEKKYAYLEYDRLYIKEDDEKIEFECNIPINEEIRIDELGISVYAEYADKKVNDGALYFTSESGEYSIFVRNRRTGDIFYPVGMNGRKKVKDYFINEKIPKSKRDKVGLIVINDEIACIIGKRKDRRFEFKDKGIKIFIKKR